MHKFLGLPPPSKKAKTISEYESTKRIRVFQQSWLAKFPWLNYDNIETQMYCKICIEFDVQKSGPFVKGCTNFRLDTLLSHDKADGHIKNLAKHKASSGPKEESEGAKAVMLLNRAAISKLKFLFKNAHYIAKSGRPYTDYVSLCHLDKSKGLEIGETYLNDKYCQKFVTAIAQCRREEQDNMINSAPYISIISDGSTDVSSTEAEVVYLKTSHNCQVNTYFIGLKNVPKADSFHISQGISSLLTKRFGDRWMGKIVAMGTDGAAVMIGKSSGVVRKIAEETQRPFVRAIHCSAHRLELAAKDAGKEVNMAKKCDLLMLNLYLFYRYIPLNRSNLKIAFRSMDQKIKIPTRVGGTRWLPHTEKALKTLLSSYDAIVCHLEQMQATPSDFRKESSAKGRWFLKLLKNKGVVQWLHFLMDVIKCLSKVSKTIQTRESTLADIFNELESAKVILNKYLTRLRAGSFFNLWHSDGPFLRKVADEDDPISQIQKTKYLDKLIKSLSDRFEGDLELFQSSTVLSINKWPEDFKKDIDFGDDKIEDLIKISAPALTANKDVDIDLTEIESEWIRLKTIISNRKQPKSSMTWESLYQTDGPSCPNLFLLVDYMLTLPGSSVDAERGFSCMKLVKSDWRSRLGEDNLSDLMLISMEVDPIATYNPMPAIEKWYTGGLRARRPFYKDDLVKSARVPAETIVIEEGEVIQVNAVSEVVEQPEVVIEDFAYSYDYDSDMSEEEDEEDELFYKTNDMITLQQKSFKLLQEMLSC